SGTTSLWSMARVMSTCPIPVTAASWDASRPTARRPPDSRRNSVTPRSGKPRAGRSFRSAFVNPPSTARRQLGSETTFDRPSAHYQEHKKVVSDPTPAPPMLPTLVLVGRPNVGKSTLFNRLTRSRAALVADFPGLTRDRHFGRARLGDRPFLVVDTGGFEPVATEGILFE